MKKANLNDYFDCLKFNDKTLTVKNNKVNTCGCEIDFEDVAPKGKIKLCVFNNDGYWMFAGVDSEDNRYVLSCGEH